jgi:RNA polymerase sigma-70 factor (sigma-E family)
VEQDVELPLPAAPADPALDPGPSTDVTALPAYAGGYEAYVRAHAGELTRTAFLLVGDAQRAEDLVQTALVKVIGRWDRIVAGGEPMPYLRTVMVRTAISWHRRKWRGEVPTEALPETSGDEPVSRVVARDALRRALLTLPRRQRAVVVLRFYEDLSEADVAQLLGCSVGTVKSQSAKGLAKLRSQLADRADLAIHPQPRPIALDAENDDEQH